MPSADSDSGPAPEPEKEWWDDPRMPWKGKPARRDILCWVGFSLTGVYALVLLPLRPVLLGANPYLLAALGGSRTTAVAIGALAATGHGWWPLGLLLGMFGSIKFDPLYWWAGKLWGRGLIEIVAGRSPRAARNAARAEKLAVRFGPLAILSRLRAPTARCRHLRQPRRHRDAAAHVLAIGCRQRSGHPGVLTSGSASRSVSRPSTWSR